MVKDNDDLIKELNELGKSQTIYYVNISIGFFLKTFGSKSKGSLLNSFSTIFFKSFWKKNDIDGIISKCCTYPSTCTFQAARAITIT